MKNLRSLSCSPEVINKGEKHYSKQVIHKYLAFCQGQIKSQVPELDLESPESGFFRLPFNKLELQFYNIRHLQQHKGELNERLGTEAGIDIDWVVIVD